MFKYHKGILPDPINNLFSTNNIRHNYHTRQTNDLQTNTGKWENVYKLFSFHGVRIWNHIYKKNQIDVSALKIFQKHTYWIMKYLNESYNVSWLWYYSNNSLPVSSSSYIISVDVDCYVHRTSSRHLSSSPSLSAPMVICQQSCWGRWEKFLAAVPYLVCHLQIQLRQGFPVPLFRRICPRKVSCLWTMSISKDVLVFIRRYTSTFVTFSFHEILNILLSNQVSSASSFLIMSPKIVHVSHPYSNVDHI